MKALLNVLSLVLFNVVVIIITPRGAAPGERKA